ncbi:agmatinase [bacterium]|nr:agmatinase [bacterium]
MNTILNDNFCNIEEKHSSYNGSSAVIIPAPYEKTTSYGQGTGNGPRAIIQASQNMESYDEELDIESYKMGIHTLKPIDFGKTEGEDALNKIQEVVGRVINDNKFPLMLGGEHSISTGAIRALLKKYPNLNVVQFDAHSDLRDSYEGTKYSHACIMRRIVDDCNIIQLGIRASDIEESKLIKERKLNTFFAYQMAGCDKWMDAAISKINGPVYITFDLDFLDPSIMPATGTPEPGGFDWYTTIRFLKKLINSQNVVGADVVELAPLKDFPTCDFTAAKLVYKILGYWHTSRI